MPGQNIVLFPQLVVRILRSYHHPPGIVTRFGGIFVRNPTFGALPNHRGHLHAFLSRAAVAHQTAAVNPLPAFWPLMQCMLGAWKAGDLGNQISMGASQKGHGCSLDRNQCLLV